MVTDERAAEKKKKCNTQSFLCTCTFCPEKEIQTSINFRTTLCIMYFKWDETLIPNASFVDHSEKLWKKRDVLPLPFDKFSFPCVHGNVLNVQ